MKQHNNGRSLLLSFSFLAVITWMSIGNIADQENNKKEIQSCNNPAYSHVCIMKTILGLGVDESTAGVKYSINDGKVEAAIKKGLDWTNKAQGKDGGWGAGTHYQQEIMDPHAVASDPATTSLVAMSLLRTGNTLVIGEYSKNLNRATIFLLKAIEDCPANQPYITLLTNTQPQIKLGRNIDVILTSQFFTDLLHYEIADALLKKRVEKALDLCITRIQKTQEKDGSWKDGGWAPVLQSALANNALETAQGVGRSVDTAVMSRSRRYQNSNFDYATNSAVTDKSAGVLLYGLSSTTRASASEAKRAKDLVEKAKARGVLNEVVVTESNLRAAGADASEAKELITAYEINNASLKQSMRADVMQGFGSNGGEEFMSYLMTGESMVMQGGNDWKKWYDMMTGKLVNIQNEDGSWNGHHCITSPVFCTGTCLLILSINNDMKFNLKSVKEPMHNQ